ncbi:hypothetical protein GUITHDRAFT_113785 [Guillardia theta CCMP2712]|uniref:RBR-type E3 ubiquitin transferase n=3 Tax=Guillardia theta TaxID=55529 RepID=L1IVA6_GUITC|nr:hypothetical protein GUITHDRAFT_113785 [Guillardia theta CCMP2712]EKX40047.1 hypothetical protein GUITHDRAFT_113785 [Guillardia theta CCMP2712]|eukprot:XP_005827027.1 hypothetical protein GUITHDRAFT_113785 [Guillardia theta CCMP2712]
MSCQQHRHAPPSLPNTNANSFVLEVCGWDAPSIFDQTCGDPDRIGDALGMLFADPAPSTSESDQHQHQQEDFHCVICQDTDAISSVRLSCGHRLHADCFKRFLAFAINDQEVTIQLPGCPNAGCTDKLRFDRQALQTRFANDDEWRVLLETYGSIERSYISWQAGILPCTSPCCQAVSTSVSTMAAVSHQNSTATVKCEGCMAMFCVGCSLASRKLVPAHVIVGCESRVLLEERLRQLDEAHDAVCQQLESNEQAELGVSFERTVRRRLLEEELRAETREVAACQLRSFPVSEHRLSSSRAAQAARQSSRQPDGSSAVESHEVTSGTEQATREANSWRLLRDPPPVAGLGAATEMRGADANQLFNLFLHDMQDEEDQIDILDTIATSASFRLFRPRYDQTVSGEEQPVNVYNLQDILDLCDRASLTALKSRIIKIASGEEQEEAGAQAPSDQEEIARSTKPCTKCEYRIQKMGGCNHMTCRKCGHQFCWMCLGAWASHSYTSCPGEPNPLSFPQALQPAVKDVVDKYRDREQSLLERRLVEYTQKHLVAGLPVDKDSRRADSLQLSRLRQRVEEPARLMETSEELYRLMRAEERRQRRSEELRLRDMQRQLELERIIREFVPLQRTSRSSMSTDAAQRVLPDLYRQYLKYRAAKQRYLDAQKEMGRRKPLGVPHEDLVNQCYAIDLDLARLEMQQEACFLMGMDVPPRLLQQRWQRPLHEALTLMQPSRSEDRKEPVRMPVQGSESWTRERLSDMDLAERVCAWLDLQRDCIVTIGVSADASPSQQGSPGSHHDEA